MLTDEAYLWKKEAEETRTYIVRIKNIISNIVEEFIPK